MRIRIESQQAPVADEVSALTAVVRPILQGLLFALKQDVVAELGGHGAIKVKMLPRLYRPGDGDCGICFEYAVHDALNRAEAAVTERVHDALQRCRVPGDTPRSIFFAAEKTGVVHLIDTAKELLTDESRVLVGEVGQPVKLKKRLKQVTAAFTNQWERLTLPLSISGLWKADLFLGHPDRDRWVGTSVKINRDQLEGAQGLRIGIVPSRQGRSDAIQRDNARNLVICPLPHDGAFMQVFYEGWQIAKALMTSDAQMPKEVELPRPAMRQVANYIVDRREFPVLDVVDALKALAQPELLMAREQEGPEGTAGAMVAPIPLSIP